MALTKIDDRGLKTPIDLLDNEKIRLGTGNDSEFVHDGTNTKWVTTNGNIRLLDDAIEFWNRAGNEPIAKFDANGSCELYHDDSKKLETTADGVTIGGDSSVSGNWDLEVFNGSGVAYGLIAGASGSWLKLQDTGSSEVLNIRAGGGHSIIQDAGTGNLMLQSDRLVIAKSDNSENMLVCDDDAGVELYYDGVKKFETNSGGITVSGGANFTSGNVSLVDNSKIKIGTGDDLQLFHDGYNRICADHLYINNKANTEVMIYAAADGAVQLYHNGLKKAATVSEGLAIYGSEGAAGELYIYADEADDDADKYRISVSDGGPLTIGNKHSGSWDTNIECNPSGNVELNFDNVKKLATDTNGITVSGNVQADGHVFPYSDSAYSLGLSTNKWTVVYADNANIQDINMSNLDAESPNEVDGTKGSWTIQEGADDLFLINRVNGKKYKFNLTQII